MGAPSETYVDPSIAANSGAGTSGDPYGDLQYALNTMTRDSTNGDRINVKAGTDEILAAALDLATNYGTPTNTAPLIFEGYTTNAGDGGVGGIDGDGTYTMLANAGIDYVFFVNMHLHNTGSAGIVVADNNIAIINCELDNTTATCIDIDLDAVVFNCYIHNVGGNAIQVNGGCVAHNYITGGTNDPNIGVNCAFANPTFVFGNIIDFDSATGGDGVRVNSEAVVMNNSIYSPSGTGQGILANGSQRGLVILNNAIQGFNGTGGVGIDLSGSGAQCLVRGGNTVGGSASTVENDPGDKLIYEIGSTDDVGASNPFTDAANDDFTPADVGSMKEGSVPATFGPNAP